MVKIELYRKLERLAVFNAKKVSELSGASREYARLLVHRMKKEGSIRKIGRDRYTVHADPLLVASHLAWPSYLSCWSSLRYYNLTEQLPVALQVITTRGRRKKVVAFENARLEFIKVRPKYFFGFERVRYGSLGLEIFLADREKTILDLVLLKKMSLAEVAEVLETKKQEFDFKRLVNYAQRAGNKSAGKRLGFLIEKLGANAKGLRRFARGKFIPLDYALPARGRKNAAWRLIENVGH